MIANPDDLTDQVTETLTGRIKYLAPIRRVIRRSRYGGKVWFRERIEYDDRTTAVWEPEPGGKYASAMFGTPNGATILGVALIAEDQRIVGLNYFPQPIESFPRGAIEVTERVRTYPA